MSENHSTTSIDTNNQIEEAFRFIEEGNQASQNGLWWSAAESFQHAYQLLHALSVTSTDTQPITNESQQHEEDENETTKMAQLFAAQSIEYKQKARASFVQALQQQQQHQPPSKNKNEKNDNFILHPDEQSRIEMFIQLFCSSLPNNITIPNSANTTSTSKDNDILSERLRALPPVPTKPASKLDELNAGLRRLGLKPILENENNNNNNAKFLHHELLFGIHPSSSSFRTEAEQVDALLQKVQDHVSLLMNHDDGNNNNNNNNNNHDTTTNRFDTNITNHEDDNDSQSTEEQVNEIIQQVQEEQLFDTHTSDRKEENNEVEENEEEEKNTPMSKATNAPDDLDNTQSAISSSSLLLTSQQVDSIMKYTLDAECQLTLVLGALEEFQTHVDQTALQSNLKEAQSLLQQAIVQLSCKKTMDSS